jgi:ubiquinone/menaquinone biosynthesis C-methylase UbiE
MIIDKEDITLATIVEATDCRASHVLEIGCGDGRLTSGLAKNSWSLIAIDPDGESLARARKRVPTVDFRTGSGENLEFPDNSFNLVLFTLSLHHQNGVKALAEAARVALPDGKILIIEPAVDSEVSLICNLYKDETTALIEAMRAMDLHAGGSAKRWEICTQWEFTDVLELLGWLSSFYDQDSSPDKDRQVLDRLGDRQYSRPLLLSDKLACTMLHMSV